MRRHGRRPGIRWNVVADQAATILTWGLAVFVLGLVFLLRTAP